MWRLRHRNLVSLSGVAITPEGQGLLLMVRCQRKGGLVPHVLALEQHEAVMHEAATRRAGY